MIGIGITYHNEGEMLYECLRSIERQTIPVDEIIIYDDASEIPCQNFIPHTLKNRIRIIVGDKNLGQGAARNAVVSALSSDYIRTQDADDILMPDWHEIIIKCTKDGGPDLILHEYDFFSGHKVFMRSAARLIQIDRFLDFREFCLSHGFVPSGAVYRKEFFKKTGGYLARSEYPYSEDFEFHLRMSTLYPKINIINDALSLQRRRRQSSSFAEDTYHSEVYLTTCKAFEAHKETLLPYYEEWYAWKFVHVAQTFYSNGKIHESEKIFQKAVDLGGETFWRLAGESSRKTFLEKGFQALFLSHMQQFSQNPKQTLDRFRIRPGLLGIH
ncbi:MAG: glycosyltransferase family 2 protein [Candidatus Omnitrophica bacterium]|nr:glycosyltransferase family 2 protein [Candidatus Omnitrophota bacterium]